MSWKMLRCLPEVTAILYLFGCMFTAPLVEQYVYSRYAEDVGFNYSASGGRSVDSCRNITENSTTYQLEKKVQEKSSSFTAGYSLASSIPALLTILYLGPLSDRYGRKLLLSVNVLMVCVSIAICMAVIRYRLKLYYMLVAQILFGVGGHFTGFLMLIMSCISDISDRDRRPFRIALVDMILLIAVTIGNLSAGIFLQKYGFLLSFLVAFCLYVGSLLYTVFILKESHPKSQRCKSSRTCLAEPMMIVDLLQKQRPGRSSLLLLTAISGVSAMLGPTVIMGIQMLFLMNSPLCWTAAQLGIYRSVYFATTAVGTVIGVKVLPKLVRNTGSLLISMASIIAGLLVMSTVKNMAMAYVAIGAGALTFVVAPLTKGVASTFCSESEQGSYWALSMWVGNVFGIIGTPTYNALYRFCLDKGYGGGVFFFASFWAVIPITLIIMYGCKSRPEELEELGSVVGNDNQESEPLIT